MYPEVMYLTHWVVNEGLFFRTFIYIPDLHICLGIFPKIDRENMGYGMVPKK